MSKKIYDSINEKNYAYKRRHKEQFKLYDKNAHKARYEIFKKYLRDYKIANPCAMCGETRHEILDFHHAYEPKKTEISTMALAALPRVQEEIDKCVVLCSFCHRKVHKHKIIFTRSDIGKRFYNPHNGQYIGRVAFDNMHSFDHTR